MKTLLIGNNADVTRDISLCLRLRWPNSSVVCSSEGTKGVELVETETPDLVISDATLPDIDGLDMIGQIRAFSEVPLIMLLQGQGEMEGVRALEVGADDFVVKPFKAIDFLARIRALLRRAQGDGFKQGQAPFLSGSLSINFATREVCVSGEPVELTPIEYNLLTELVRNQRRVLTHRTLLEKVWGPEYDTDFGLIKDHIYRLRKKLENGGNTPPMVVSVRGVGYKFVPAA